MISAYQIFEENNILMMGIIPVLIGKRIAITNPESKYNKPSVRIFTVLGTETLYEAALKMEHSTYANLQAMWIAEGNEKAIEDAKSRIVLKYDGDTPFATCQIGNRSLADGMFFGSDEDRPIYYSIVKN